MEARDGNEFTSVYMGIPYTRSHVELQDGDRAAVNCTQTLRRTKEIGCGVYGAIEGWFMFMGRAVDGRWRVGAKLHLVLCVLSYRYIVGSNGCGAQTCRVRTNERLACGFSRFFSSSPSVCLRRVLAQC